MLSCTLTLERQSADSKSSAIPGCSIVVTGVIQDVDVEEELVPLLENKRKGGGPVEKAERLNLSEDSVLITFVDQSSMTRLLRCKRLLYTFVTTECNRT